MVIISGNAARASSRGLPSTERALNSALLARTIFNICVTSPHRQMEGSDSTCWVSLAPPLLGPFSDLIYKRALDLEHGRASVCAPLDEFRSPLPHYLCLRHCVPLENDRGSPPQSRHRSQGVTLLHPTLQPTPVYGAPYLPRDRPR